MELELDEEKNSAEMLTERITRSRDQVYIHCYHQGLIKCDFITELLYQCKLFIKVLTKKKVIKCFNLNVVLRVD